MSSIVTFYSYKGGVGRSMALANIAVLLARRELRVLAVDWDLEAPGLERYFAYFQSTLGGTGLLRMCMTARDSGTANYKDFVSFVDCDARYPITVLTSGREQDEAYTRNLELFDWEDFFSINGGTFLEELRRQWREDYDVVLIDSRTGLSDTGGICTIQLPDIVVAMFTANYQSLYGVRDVMRLAQKARQNLAYDRMPLSILPLPARWGVQEFQETRVWLERVAEALKEFYDDWLPSTVLAREIIERIKIPQADFFGFGEKLAVVEQGTSDPQGMGFVYDKVAAFIAADFTDVRALVGERFDSANSLSTEKAVIQNTTLVEDSGYVYDVFVSYDHSLSEWILEFVETLRAELAVLRGVEPKIFLDVSEIRLEQSWENRTREVLLRSKVAIAALTPQYLSSKFCVRELATFRMRSTETGRATLLPLLIRGSDSLRQILSDVEWFDFRKLPIQKVSDRRKSSMLQREVMRIADQLSRMIDGAPPFEPFWIDASDTDAADLSRLVENVAKSDWRKQILWVDDRPGNNVYERRVIESLGVTFSLAESTQDALETLSSQRFGVIISDMGRREGPTEGYVLLNELRRRGDTTPFIIYAGSNAVKHKQEAEVRGAQGSTNDPQELLELIKGILGLPI